MTFYRLGTERERNGTVRRVRKKRLLSATTKEAESRMASFLIIFVFNTLHSHTHTFLLLATSSLVTEKC